MKTHIQNLFIALALIASLTQTTRAAVTFTNTPAVVSNTYTGTITLQIGGLTNTETVLIRKYLDLNANGVVDAGDILWQQFLLTDGSASVFHDGVTAVTNFNVPGDTDGSTNGSITALLYPSQDFAQRLVGKYLFVLSSPSGHFLPQTNSFSITNFSFAQSFAGNVVSNTTPLTNALVFLFQPSAGNLTPQGPQGGVVANNSGAYAIKAPTGTYLLAAMKSNFVANLNASPYVTLNAGAMITTNVPMTNATKSISGQIVDINDPSTGLPALLVPLQSTNNYFAIAFTDTNGNFTGGVTPSLWKVQSSDRNIDLYGYVRSQNNANVDTSTGNVSGVTLYLSKATAIFYGTVKDNLGNPLTGIDIYSYDNNGDYEVDGYSYTNGSYVVGALAGGGDPWQIQASILGNPTNYVFSQESSSVTLTNGQAYQYNFTAFPATNLITGHVQDSNGNPISGVGVNTTSDIGYQSSTAFTDTNGNYSMNVINGNWSVSVELNDGENSLDSILGSGNYQPPSNQIVNITNNNGTANFIVLPPNSGQIYGYVKDAGGSPVAGATIYAGDDIGDSYANATDASGFYSFIVTNGNWDVSVDCGVLNSLGYQCVSDQITNISDDDVEVDFVVQSQLPLTLLHTFTALDSATQTTNTDGANPVGGLILSGNILYGTTQVGGTYGNGTVFAVNTNTLIFPTLHSFSAGNINSSGIYTNGDGANPAAGLILSGNILYGTAQFGGTNGNGTVFAVNTNGMGFSVLHTFTALDSATQTTNGDGANPAAGLILSGNILYGTAQHGGTNGNGTVFAVNTNGMGFSVLHTFAALDSATQTTNSDGANPSAGLILSGNILYGTAQYGGTNGNGTVFAVNVNGTGFTTLHTFTAQDPFYGTNYDGANPAAGLISSGNILYGTTQYGGTNVAAPDDGTVFAVNTDGSNFRTLHDFDYNDGSQPVAGLILSGNTLYGTASVGFSSGSVFAVNTDGMGFKDLYEFSGGKDGAIPLAGLILSGNTLYGTTAAGGTNNNGTVFAISLGAASVSALQLTISLAGTNVILEWPTSATGFTLQYATNLVSPTLWNTNLPSPVVVNGQNAVTNSISGTKKFYRLSQ